MKPFIFEKGARNVHVPFLCFFILNTRSYSVLIASINWNECLVSRLYLFTYMTVKQN